MTRLLFIAVLVSFAGCTTYKLWADAESDPDQGLVRLSYEYRKFESPHVDELGGINMARERCRDWGYASAQRKGEERQCIDGLASDCGKWRVTREYRCVK